MTQLRIFPRHARKLGVCVAGQKRMAESLGIDFRIVVREGIAESDFAKIEHPLVPKIIDVARQESKDE